MEHIAEVEEILSAFLYLIVNSQYSYFSYYSIFLLPPIKIRASNKTL